MEIKWNQHVVILYDKYRDASIAKALGYYIEREFVSADVIPIDSVAYTGTSLSRIKHGYYKHCARHSRALLATVSVKKDSIEKKRVNELLRTNGYSSTNGRINPGRIKRIINIIKRFEPIMVICTTPEVLKMTLMGRTYLGKEFNVVAAVQDFSLDLAFVRGDADGYFVENPEVKQKLIASGIQQERIAVVGFPTLGFDINGNKFEKRAKLGINGASPVVTVYGGDYDTHTLKADIVNLIKNKNDEYTLVIVTGDKSLRKYYMDLPDFSAGVLINTELSEDLLDVTDVLVTVPETAAIFNAFMRGIGVIVAPAVTLLEKQIRKYLVKRALVIPARTSAETLYGVKELLDEADRRAEFKKRGEIYASMSLNDLRNIIPQIDNIGVKKLTDKNE